MWESEGIRREGEMPQAHTGQRSNAVDAV